MLFALFSNSSLALDRDCAHTACRYPPNHRFDHLPHKSYPRSDPMVARTRRGSSLRSRSVGDHLHSGGVFEGARGALS
jgi:hypothetical protein